MKISIILATFNAGRYVGNLLSSIESQKRSDVEFIVVDGKSTDNTIEIINRSGLADIVISETDEGIYDAWNKGISASRGQWIMFVGADDALNKNIIDELISVIESTSDDTDYITGKNLYIDDSNNVVKIFGGPPCWDKMRKWNVAAHVASLHNRRLFSEIGQYDTRYKICADYELLLRKREKLRFIFVDKIFARMRIGGVSYSYRAIFECLKIRGNLKTVNQMQNFCIFCFNSIAFFTSKTLIRLRRF